MNFFEKSFYEDLKKDIIILTNKIKEYLDNYNINYEFKYEEFKDYFDETWRVIKIILKIEDIQDYIERYLYNRMKEIAKNNLDEDKRKKIVIIINAD